MYNILFVFLVDYIMAMMEEQAVIVGRRRFVGEQLQFALPHGEDECMKVDESITSSSDAQASFSLASAFSSTFAPASLP